MRAAIENLLNEGTNKVVILGAMVELGAESKNEHDAIVSLLESIPGKLLCVLVVICKTCSSVFRYPHRMRRGHG